MRRMGTGGLINFYPFVLFVLVIAYTYPCFSSSYSTKNNTQLCLPDQQDALIRFRNACNITTWDEHIDCCLWHDISCDSKTGDVTEIVVFEPQLRSTIDHITYLFPLYNLQKLDLSFNNFYGVVPPELSLFSKLTILNLAFNEELTMESRSLELLVQNLTQLETLRLDAVTISGYSSNTLMNVSTTLTSLSLQDCDLKGMFPSSIFHLPNLGDLNLKENIGLTVSLPTFNWTSQLDTLDLSSTNFSGKLPDSIGNLKNLIILDLSSCHISNPIPSSIGNLTQLVMLSLSSFAHRDAIPTSICHLSSLTLLALPRNKFSGMIPQCLGNLINLRWLDLSSNQLTGPFPQSLANCTQLAYLNVSFNMISDRIIHWVEFFPRLTVIDLGTNSFHGEIPLSICKSNPNLVDLSNNKLTGTIPSCLVSYMPNDLKILNLRMNKLEGTIPDTFPHRCPQVELDLSNNQLKGPLPRSIVNCKNLMVLHLGDNIIEDLFPNWLENLTKLQILILNFNKLHGQVKTFLNHHPFPNLKIFDISTNNLTGLLPTEYMSQFDAMKDEYVLGRYSIYLQVTSDYSYEYSMSITIKGRNLILPKVLKALKLIDFSNNNFLGEIPEVIGDLIALKGLNLSYNNLIGYIPPSIRSMTHLEWLDLSSNKLTGRIPVGLSQLTELGSLNLSYNELRGMIPTGKQFDTFGKDSFLGNEGLCGFQIEVACGEPQAPQRPPLPSVHEDDFDFFDWKIILMGYGCGLVIGISIGYIVFELRRPECFVSLVEEKLLKKITRPRRRANRLRRT